MTKAVAIAVVLLSGIMTQAQTITITSVSPQSIVLSMPCANHGKGLTISFAGIVHAIFHEVLVNNKGHVVTY
jgi:hypothetical protein